MAEAVAVLGLLAAIGQFVEQGTRLATRLSELSSTSKGFGTLQARLHAVIAILGRVKAQLERHGSSNNNRLGRHDEASEIAALRPVLEACLADVKSLLDKIAKWLPPKAKKGDGGGEEERLASVRRYVRAVRSLAADKDVARVSGRLQEGLLLVNLWQTTLLVERSWQGGSLDGGIDGDKSAVPHHRLLTPSEEGVDPEMSSEQINTPSSIMTPSTCSVAEQDGNTTGSRRTSLETARKDADLPGDGVERCMRFCSCVCHRPWSISTPHQLSWLIGRLSVSYGGFQTLYKFPCSERRCKGNVTPTGQLTLQFPRWLLSKALHASMTSTALNTHINLNTFRILPPTAEVFSVLTRGDLPVLRDMFATGRASIHDISPTNWTLLHTAYTLGHTSIASFLLQQGADPTISANNGSNVVERAWFHAQKTARVPGEYVLSDNDILRAVDVDEFVSQQQFTLIHKAVLGLSHLPLADLLETSTTQVDTPDSRGCTPLWWASAQGNLGAIETLLSYGANHGQGGPLNQTPLHVARDAPTVRLLHDGGALIDARDTLRRTPLHCYCYRQVGASPHIVRAALDCGADANARASGEQTPLHYAVMFGNTCLVSILVQYQRQEAEGAVLGANLEARMREGLTPLASAIRYDQAGAAEALLGFGADLRARNDAGESVAELAARWAGVTCLELLAASVLRRQDTKPGWSLLCDKAILRDIFSGRSLRWEELDKAFAAFLEVMLDQDMDRDHATCNEARDCPASVGMPGAFVQENTAS
jgi:ankyrin repeat protein